MVGTLYVCPMLTFPRKINRSSVGLVCIRDTNLVITVPADILAPNGATSSLATVLTNR